MGEYRLIGFIAILLFFSKQLIYSILVLVACWCSNIFKVFVEIFNAFDVEWTQKLSFFIQIFKVLCTADFNRTFAI